jgi:hypothetical protein
MPSRFAGIGRTKALLVFGALFIFVALNVELPHWAATQQPSAPAAVSAESSSDDATQGKDILLYQTINKRMATGERYYAAAASEHRKGGYPLKPFVVVRPPTMAILANAIGPMGLQLALWGLIAGTLFVWWRRLSEDFPTHRYRPIIVFLLATTMAARPEMTFLHESWAGILILLSIGLHDQRRWWPSVATGFLAVTFRETALPYLLLMMALALVQRRWTETAAWLAALGAEAAYLAFHATEVAKVVLPTDLSSQGWTQFGGWASAVDFFCQSSLFALLPKIPVQVLLSLALFGWLAWKQFAGLAAFLLVCGYAFAFMIIGRPENFYWGMLVAPVLLGGLVFAPRGLRDLWNECKT